MVDDRAGVHAAVAPAEEIHDDDELAAALAAELERIAPTGAVPVLRASAVPFGPATSVPPSPPATDQPAQPPAEIPQPATEQAPAGRPTVTRTATAPVSDAQVPRPMALGPRPARRPPSPGAGTQEHHRNAAAARSGEPAPGRRRAADAAASTTQPVRIQNRDRPSPAAPPSGDAGELHVPLRESDSLPSPPTLYESWEQSLRSIGRPPIADEVAPMALEHREPDAPAVAMSPAALGPLPEPPAKPAGVSVDAPPVLVEETSGEPRRRRGGRRTRREQPEPAQTPSTAPATPLGVAGAATDALDLPGTATDPVALPDAATRALALPEAAPAPIGASEAATTPIEVSSTVPDSAPDDAADGVDEVDTGIRAVSAADTAAVPLPPMLEPGAPASGTIAVVAEPGARERPSPLGGPSLLSLLLLWCGALASPVLLLAGFGLAATGAGGAAAGALLIGVGVAVPAAVRITEVAEADGIGSPALAARLFGSRGGTVVAAVLLAARLLVVVLALLAVADLAAAFVARTGVGGTSTAVASVGAATLAGLAALAVAVCPRRIMRVVLGALAAVALVATVAVLVATAPAVAVTVPASPPPATSAVALALAFAMPGLVLTATAADAVRTASSRGRSRSGGTAIVLSALVGLIVLVFSLAVGRGAGATGDAATAFAGVVADATPAPVAAPLAALLLLAALPLPALLITTAGDAAAVLIGAGRSARLGAVAAGLLALAAALVLLAVGESAPSAVVGIGPLLGVPVAVWTGVTTISPLRGASGRPTRIALIVGSAVSTVVGWLLVDGLVAVGERSPFLQVLRIPDDSVWRASPALGLLVAFVLGLVVAVLARAVAGRAAAPPASRLRSGSRAVDSVEG